jgi:DNA-binding CsgD family transcriptional regulator
MIPTPSSTLERAAELDVLATVARRSSEGQGQVVIVEGPAGIGKTTMLREARSLADGHGLRTLWACGTQLEQPIGFGQMRQLLDGLARDVLDGSGPPDSIASAVEDARGPLGLSATARTAPTDPRDAEHAVLALALELARVEPLAFVVDDAQWCDEPSLRVLARLAARADAMSLLVVVATRPPGDPGAAAGTDGLRRAAGAIVLRPDPLSDAAAARLVRSMTADASDEECADCQAASRGNPLFLRELARALRTTPSPGTGRVPRSIAAAVERRLASLSDAARGLAEAVAIFEPRATLARCAQLAGLTWPVAVAAADELVGAAVVAHEDTLVFAHPVVRSAVHDAIAPARRAGLHASAAAALHEDGVELDSVAAHLLQAPARGDATVVERLLAAARAAMGRGATDAAIAYLRRAVAEPPPPGPGRADLLLALGDAEMTVGAMDVAEDDLRRAMDAGEVEPETRLRAAVALGQVMSAGDRLAEGVRLLDAELERAGAVDDGLRARAETVLLNVARMDADANATVARRAERLRRLVREGADATPEQLATAAAAEAQAGESADRTAAVGIRALDGMAGRPGIDALSFGQAARALIAADRLDAATAALREEIDVCRRRGVRFTVGFLMAMLAEARYRAGALPEAERLMREALAPDMRWEVGRAAMLSVLAKTLLEQGKVDDAGALLATVVLDGGSAPPSQRYPVIMGLQARGRWRLASGDHVGALLDFESCGPRLEACAEPNPALVEWRSDAAWALLALGETDRARAHAADELARARTYGAARPIATALRALAAASPPAERDALLRDALTTLESSSARLVGAEVHADLGFALGRGAEAREHLTVALEFADACGAQPLARRVRRALSRAGARPRRAARTGSAALTAAERRVVTLAADGLTNRAIAEQLVVTVRTVELHLTNSYRKLGIDSRAALSRALADG